MLSRWWFQIFFYFHPELWGRCPIWLMFAQAGVSIYNQPYDKTVQGPIFGMGFNMTKTGSWRDLVIHQGTMERWSVPQLGQLCRAPYFTMWTRSQDGRAVRCFDYKTALPTSLVCTYRLCQDMWSGILLWQLQCLKGLLCAVTANMLKALIVHCKTLPAALTVLSLCPMTRSHHPSCM